MMNIKETVAKVKTDTSGKWVSIEEVEKLAMLVVRECTSVSRKVSHRDDDMGAIIAKDIERHFGVEP